MEAVALAYRLEMELPVSPSTLTAALEGLVATNAVMMCRCAELGGHWPPLYEAGIRYVADPPGGRSQKWPNAAQVLLAGQADCKGLAAWRAAELRMEGEPAQAYAYESGPQRYHAVVRRGDGSTEDPSAILGMGRLTR
jgi:hypothetical protein